LGSAVDWPPALYAPFTPNPKVAYFCAALWSGFTPPLTAVELRLVSHRKALSVVSLVGLLDGVAGQPSAVTLPGL
jgi:hypothetical protein